MCAAALGDVRLLATVRYGQPLQPGLSMGALPLTPGEERRQYMDSSCTDRPIDSLTSKVPRPTRSAPWRAYTNYDIRRARHAVGLQLRSGPGGDHQVRA